ncbi:MAG TPA: LacI family DNA-binding transcriptional regulator [Terriglobales bacterium]|nr:LacI family DNA-binding transcriptional regulator [Terriglobales bacterium]
MKSTKTTLVDIANSLGVSTGTVHRALHNHPGINQLTKTRVLEMAKTLGYRTNRAARSLSLKRKLRISVNTLKGTTSFWDEVRTGIEQEATSLGLESVEVEYRTYPQLGDGDEEAFEAALKADVNGIIMFPSSPGKVRGWIHRASPAHIPIVCVATDAPGTGRLAVVSVDTMVSGSLAADLLGRFLKGQGSVAVTVSDLAILEHAEKVNAFQNTLRSFYPLMSLEVPIEDHDIESEAYDKCRKLFQSRPDLVGIYVTTEASIPVLNAARDAGMLDKLAVITTDLFPALVREIRSGAVTATIHQRPRTQGVMAFRVLHDFLVDGQRPSPLLTLAPHLVMRGNLDFFLERRSFENASNQEAMEDASAEVGGYSVG